MKLILLLVHSEYEKNREFDVLHDGRHWQTLFAVYVRDRCSTLTGPCTVTSLDAMWDISFASATRKHTYAERHKHWPTDKTKTDRLSKARQNSHKL